MKKVLNPEANALFLRLKKFIKEKKRKSTFALEVDPCLFDRIEDKIIADRKQNIEVKK